MDRWRTNKKNFHNLGRLGDKTTFRDLPDELATDAIEDAFGGKKGTAARGVVVCGSPYEIANDLSLGGDSHRNGFEQFTQVNRTGYNFHYQRKMIWATISVTGKDQLRQRMAWTLSQILTVSPGSINARDATEAWVNYHGELYYRLSQYSIFFSTA